MSRSLDRPLTFAPYFRPQIWGGRRLQALLGKKLPSAVSVGESWELSCQTLHVSCVSDGPLRGVSLAELWKSHRDELWGTSAAAPPQFPWLIKWLDCHELLSVQVHPNDQLAQQMLGEPFGKTESWFVLHAEPTGRIYAGLRAGVTRDELETRSQDGTVAECLHSFQPRAGDCLHIPAGTVHAVGGGVVMAEVQQTSDTTFRLFDWNRVDGQGKSRELHLAQALEAIDFQRGPVSPQAPELLPASSAGVRRESLVRCPYYALERVTFDPYANDQSANAGMSVWMLLDGEAQLVAGKSDSPRKVRQGETILLPAAVKSVRWQLSESPATLLRVTVPQ